jgi:hypothetical protein
MKTLKKLASLIFVVSLYALSLQAQDFVKGQLIVKFKPGVLDFPVGAKRVPVSAIALNSESVANHLQNIHAMEIEKVFTKKAPGDTIGYHVRTGERVRIIDQSQVYVIALPEDADIPRLVKELSNLPEVEYAHENYIGSTTGSMPNDDPSGQYFLFQSSDKDIDPYDPANTSAWDITRGNNSVKIGIIDSGIEHVLDDLGQSIGPNSKVLDGWHWSGLSDTRDTYGQGIHLI